MLREIVILLTVVTIEVVILLSIVTIVKCNQICWQCSDESNLALCRNNTVTCSTNEECFLEKAITDTNAVVYSGGCRSNKVCQIMQAVSGVAIGKRSTGLCGKCCTGPHCQDTLCGLTSSGPSLSICLSCNSVSSPAACMNSEVCQDTEVCSAGIHIEGGSLVRYSLGCESKHLCREQAAYLTPGHPGRAIVNAISICDSCCVSDHCNKADCYVLMKNMTVSMFST
ncbi:uncharacterized protein LOC110447774 isoform X1 [Mizuhopecten yessoensis]|uniref:uncharacterized protein LOC110447774 isoform X1 n=1 Tax=Mizuhopecten yessoensis TaxID=6573 RepID=UPI000B45BE50|nr:uncharacterized protein LOC110447774 isoform X1 [Mizuhopecten yessoensis]